MAEGNGAAAEAPAVYTRESLFPEGWDKPQPETPEAGQDAVPEEAAADDDLAEAQVEDEQEQVAEEVPEAVLGRMRLNDFLDAAGVSMEEFYRDVYVTQDGKEVSVSAAWDEHKRLAEANEALLRERSELQERVNQVATQAPQAGIAPEAQALLAQAQIYQTALQNTDWSQVDPGAAANQKFDLQQAIQQCQQQAQAKQQEYLVGVQNQMAQAQAEADRQTRALIPEWTNAQVYETEWKQIADMMHGYGVSPEEVNRVSDPRIKRFMRDSLKLRGEKQRIVEGAKRVRKVSKTLGAGARAPEKPAPTLKGAKQTLAEAKRKGATREQLQRMRLNMPLG